MRWPAHSRTMLQPKADHCRSASEALAKNAELIDCLFLVKNGVPFDVAFTLPPDERFAYVVILGELAGGRFDWGAMRWIEDRP